MTQILQADRPVRFVTDDEDYFVIVRVDEKTAQRGTNAIARGEFTEIELALAISNAINLKAMPGLIASATSAERSPKPESSRPVSTDEEEGQDV